MSDLVGQLDLFTPEWPRPAPEVIAAIKAWNDGHTCERCGHGCGTTQHHTACCGTERQHRHTIGSYCTGHPCRACNPRPIPCAPTDPTIAPPNASPGGANSPPTAHPAPPSPPTSA